MSDLRHQTPRELRRRIAAHISKKADLKTQWEADEVKIMELRNKADKARKQFHNIGQSESWARYYLAQKELP